jgi:hypothetical protein
MEAAVEGNVRSPYIPLRGSTAGSTLDKNLISILFSQRRQFYDHFTVPLRLNNMNIKRHNSYNNKENKLRGP